MIRVLGHDVYDFKKPNNGNGFQWTNIDPNWQDWTMEQYKQALKDDYAQFGFNRDFDAMKSADICVLCLPCGRSAHLEAGWMKGAGKKVIAFIPPDERIEPELMYGMLDGIALSLEDLSVELAIAFLGKEAKMTPDEIIKLAKETRDVQKRYFATRDRYDLSMSKALEHQLDQAIEDYQNPKTDLFNQQ